MRKRNALVLALLGSISIVASVALVARFFSGTEREVPGYRYDQYSQRMTEETKMLENAMEKDPAFREKVDMMREQGYSDKKIIEMLQDQGDIQGIVAGSAGKMIVLP